MIQYENSSFGFLNLLRIQGSPVYKVALPTCLSTGLLLFLDIARARNDYDDPVVKHSYAVGAFIGFFSILLTFRLNFAYSRYWEGATAIHQMISKWTDAAMILAAFHYQSESFKGVHPPSFASHPTATAVDLQRRRVLSNTPSMSSTIDHVQFLQAQAEEEQKKRKPRSLFGRRTRKENELQKRKSVLGNDINTGASVVVKFLNRTSSQRGGDERSRIPIPLRFQERFQQASASVREVPDPRKVTSPRGRGLKREETRLQCRHVEMPGPSLFFQELAHLVSLLAGVAMSTLRNHIEGVDLPIVEYIPGKPWPPVDPDALSSQLKHQYGGDSRFWQSVYYILGFSRNERQRALYNAARPFTVLGGVSDEEMLKLNRARGPSAKVALCTLWLVEFISREILHGSAGKVSHPLLARAYRHISDGCVGYNQARKIAYVPSPFPEGQMSSIFVFIVLFIFPVVFQSYVKILWFGCFMNTLTVLCFLGLHEVARELEDPFHNIPNDLPLTTFQAQMNEALVTMYAGFHPDAHWTIVDA